MAARLIPTWAQWTLRPRPARPFASVHLPSEDGPIAVGLLAIGRGWVSLRVPRAGSDRCEVWRPCDIDWSNAQLHSDCLGVLVKVQAQEHRALRAKQTDDAIWRWVHRAVAIDACVEGLW